MITDAQIHVWEVDRPDRPWPKPQRGDAQRPNGYYPDEAIRDMDAAGVDRAIIVPPVVVGENNATALEAADKYPGRFAVMGRFDALAPDARGRLDGWLKQLHMLGIRMTFRFVPSIEQLDDGSLDWFWAACEKDGIPLMMFLPGMADKALSIVERHPGLTVIFDHMARNLTLRGPDAFADLDVLLQFAAYPRVCVKVSSVPNFSAEPYPHRDIHSYLRRIFDTFGPRRLFWGSDVTRLSGSYRDCLRLFQEGLDFLTPSDRELVLGGALAEVLRWPEA